MIEFWVEKRLSDEEIFIITNKSIKMGFSVYTEKYAVSTLLIFTEI